MDLERVTRGKTLDLNYHLFDIVKRSPERYFDCGVVTAALTRVEISPSAESRSCLRKSL
jgi:hypothetical protein